MRRVQWGILSTSRFGQKWVIPAMQGGKYCEISAIASRNLENARAAATLLGIRIAYGSYEELLAAPGIEAIYIPLPNHLHVPWAIKALVAGKHVLCEKAIALTSIEAKELLASAKQRPNLKVMEAFMYRHHPQWMKARQIVVDGGIGELRTIRSIFSYWNVDPSDIRNISELGGGALMDVGCYCISLARFIFGGEPQGVLGFMEYDPKYKTDRFTSGMLDFGNGVSTFSCSTQLAAFQRVDILGTDGRIEMQVPFNPDPARTTKVLHVRGNETTEVTFDPCNQHTIQGDLFSLAVLDDTEVPTPLEDAVANMRALECIIQSAGHGSWVRC